MKASIPIGIPQSTRLLRIDRDDVLGEWRLWIHFNKTCTLGTYYRLRDDGSMWCVTVRDNEGDDEYEVKPASKDSTINLLSHIHG